MQNAERATAQDERKTNRVGSVFVRRSELEHPQTVGQRMTRRRLELGLTQEEVADKCHITMKSHSATTGRKKGETSPLSRTAYGMYEKDAVVPVLDVVVQIASVLGLSAAYLAFGEGPTSPLEEYGYKAETDAFESHEITSLDAGWLIERLDLAVADPKELVVIGVDENSGLTLVRRGVEPGRVADGEYVYALNGEVHVGGVTRNRGEVYRVYGRTKKDFREVSPEDINILGEVVCKIAC